MGFVFASLRIKMNKAVASPCFWVVYYSLYLLVLKPTPLWLWIASLSAGTVLVFMELWSCKQGFRVAQRQLLRFSELRIRTHVHLLSSHLPSEFNQNTKYNTNTEDPKLHTSTRESHMTTRTFTETSNNRECGLFYSLLPLKTAAAAPVLLLAAAKEGAAEFTADAS